MGLIAINLIVPFLRRDEIDSRESDSFKIISMFSHGRSVIATHYVYVIETTEEEATYLALKYGNNYVWKR